MAKFKFTAEFELKASPKVLFPYLSSASGLQQWFAAKVNMRGSQSYDFLWDGESHPAKQTVLRVNKASRFDFQEEGEVRDLNYVEFKIEQSELTQTTFLKVSDYSTNDDTAELEELWEGLIHKLKEVAGC